MARLHSPELLRLLELYPAGPDLAAARRRLERDELSPQASCALFDELLPALEQALWASPPDAAALALYQAAFREQEQRLAARGDDRRHRFVVIIPVADRPQHLGNILASLLQLCETFAYGGLGQGRYRKLTVVIADDSRDPAVIADNGEIVSAHARQGLDVRHFDAGAQEALLRALPAARYAALAGVLGDPLAHGFAHKGASITRNLACLLANGLQRPGEPTLFMFVDSDEQFMVRTLTAEGQRDVAAVNYFYHLDRIFSRGDAQLLTGKVVGDPPVSPAVMADNFLADLVGFLQELATEAPEAACGFHGEAAPAVNDAAYHDMADLFGFRGERPSYRYRCGLDGAHDHRACLEDFAARLDRFFHGEHPTRVTLFEHGDGFETLTPARTVYTGNYVCTAAGLRHFVPFAPLKLRMAGPVLGRLLRAELGDRFVSANLPLLHTRTVETDERFEFRPGVSREASATDLSGEFERQFFGDLMLFAMERLIEQGYPQSRIAAAELGTILDDVEENMRRRYREQGAAIMARLEQARSLLDDPDQWWQHRPEAATAVNRFREFFANIARNFGAGTRAYRLIEPGPERDRRRAEIERALAAYTDDRVAWAAALDADARTRAAGR